MLRTHGHRGANGICRSAPPPTFTGSLGTDNSMTITFSEAVTKAGGGSIGVSEFVVSATGSGVSVSSFSVSTTSSSVYVITPTLSGTPDGSQGLSVDVASNAVASVGTGSVVAQNAVTETMHERVPPTFAAAVQADNTVVIDFSEAVSAADGQAMDAAALLVTVTGGSATLDSYAVATNSATKYTATLTLTGVPDGGEAVAVDVAANQVLCPRAPSVSQRGPPSLTHAAASVHVIGCAGERLERELRCPERVLFWEPQRACASDVHGNPHQHERHHHTV